MSIADGKMKTSKEKKKKKKRELDCSVKQLEDGCIEYRKRQSSAAGGRPLFK